jgi:hypothetical protein
VSHGGLWGWGLREKSMASGHDGGDACRHHSLARGAVEVSPLLLPSGGGNFLGRV